MKKKLLLGIILSFFIICPSVFAQITYKTSEITFNNLGDGKLFAKERYGNEIPLNGKIRIIDGYSTQYIDANFKEGFPDGKFEHYKDNKLEEVKNYKDGLLDGEQTTYGLDGNILLKTPMNKGKVDGTAEQFHSNGKKKYEKSMKNGVDEGPERSYSEDGTLRSETIFKNGKAEGKSFSILDSDDKKITETKHYKSGKLDGEYSKIFENGNILDKGSYIDGKKDGVWESYKRDGKRNPTEEYKNGDLIKKTTYFTDGKIEKETNLQNGKKNGIEKIYSPDGNLKSEKNYTEGKQVGKQVIYMTTSHGEQDHYIETSTYNANEKYEGEVIQVYDKSKKTRAKGSYINGQKDGKWSYFNTDGTLYREEYYDKGKMTDSKKF